MNIENTIRNLKRRGFQARYFQTKEEAAAELAASLRHTTIGIGGCKTADQMGLYEILSAENEVIWHWKSEDRDAAQISAAHAKVYIMSANALSETGEIVIFLVGINKLAPDLPAAIDRARNVASPLNARRFGRKTPCVLSEPMRCHDCSSPERICKGLAILMEKMSSIAEMDVYLIGEELGY